MSLRTPAILISALLGAGLTCAALGADSAAAKASDVPGSSRTIAT